MKQWQWLSLLAGGAVVVVGGVILLERKATAATPAPAANNNTVSLQPGATTIAPVRGSTVTLQLPSGASWSSVTAEGSTTVPQQATFTFTAGDDAQVVAYWSDASHTNQQTTINVVPPGPWTPGS
jgi:hypothetical protein